MIKFVPAGIVRSPNEKGIIINDPLARRGVIIFYQL